MVGGSVKPVVVCLEWRQEEGWSGRRQSLAGDDKRR